jgi:hypothetical protein
VYPADISWEPFLAHQARLMDHATTFTRRACEAPRHGQALLAGLAEGVRAARSDRIPLALDGELCLTRGHIALTAPLKTQAKLKGQGRHTTTSFLMRRSYRQNSAPSVIDAAIVKRVL